MIFAKMLMEQGLLEKRDFETYRALSENMANFMKRPNLIVHLDVSPEESLARIKSRYALISSSHNSSHTRALSLSVYFGVPVAPPMSFFFQMALNRIHHGHFHTRIFLNQSTINAYSPVCALLSSLL